MVEPAEHYIIFQFFRYIRFFISITFTSNTFIGNTKLKLKNQAKNQAKAKQHHEAELLLFENRSLSSSTVSSKSIRVYSKECAIK